MNDEKILEELEKIFDKSRQIKLYVGEQKERLCNARPNETESSLVLNYLHKH